MEAVEYEKMYLFEEGNWWYKGRRELLLKIISKIEKEEGYLKILDAGCGTGLHLKALKNYGDATGLDISQQALRYSKSRGNISLICGLVDKLPFKSSTFNIVCCLDVLEHIKDDLSAIAELYRVLRPEGYLILTVPAFPFLWSRHDIANHHERRYNRSELLDALLSCGFRVEKSTYWNFFLLPLVAILRLIRKEDQNMSTDLEKLPDLANLSLLGLLRIESTIINKNISLPIGVSILCICRKCSVEHLS